mmetsp:Transcript_21649/g.43763  ORF Transcript_21649/g.43763 Transcript_21649/m.43763 type:complete len:87 (+) Transcript_21649:102-362(+)|eukprot:CAMPEP_0183307464 /NCGR_PEP_ID=MMETSP0160_2-20130417/17430_1 /TAXON_ID=2839 ORGANISM="Odontella Sinensis, Strain Grunow 1884" /NCGR_SAMPLE_ID=MMETSP0160_2 /ASSEMBLY_ACC=CAM_ASM_000250 /LENGTH=86 /DNA_ID=CAMNT_0025471053 /DNA_START=66 /DNA_END=326 /DNA_ORIENTATION=+
MRLALSVVALVAVSASAFAPSTPFSRGIASSVAGGPSASQLWGGEEDEEEEGGLDLNLEEMFDMFDAADKGEDFDKAVDKIKGEDK